MRENQTNSRGLSGKRLPVLVPLALMVLLAGWVLPIHAEHQEKVRKHWGDGISSEILAVQQDIVNADAPGGYYDTDYQHAEPFYWWHIPGWMQADASHHKVARILDLGCGYGTLLSVAASIYGASGFCMDVTEYLPPEVQAKRKLTFLQGNAELDPIPGGPYDVIVMTEVLEHFNFQPVPTLAKIRKAMAPNGVFFLSTPDAKEWGKTQQYYQRLEDIPPVTAGTTIIDDHIWLYSEAEFRQVVQQAGLSIVKFDRAPGIGHRHFNVVLKAAK